MRQSPKPTKKFLKSFKENGILQTLKDTQENGSIGLIAAIANASSLVFNLVSRIAPEPLKKPLEHLATFFRSTLASNMIDIQGFGGSNVHSVSALAKGNFCGEGNLDTVRSFIEPSLDETAKERLLSLQQLLGITGRILDLHAYKVGVNKKEFIIPNVFHLPKKLPLIFSTLIPGLSSSKGEDNGNDVQEPKPMEEEITNENEQDPSSDKRVKLSLRRVKGSMQSREPSKSSAINMEEEQGGIRSDINGQETVLSRNTEALSSNSLLNSPKNDTKPRDSQSSVNSRNGSKPVHLKASMGSSRNGAKPAHQPSNGSKVTGRQTNKSQSIQKVQV